jgi:regulator of protease activity HflC (stomatin/prohibitin superfamily)
MTREIESRPLSGAAGLGLFFVLLLGSIIVLLPGTPIEPVGLRVVLIAVGFLLTAFTLNGFFIVQPGQAELLVLLGNYRGTVRASGWWWVNPLMSKRKISLRVRSLNGDKIKVNDKDGNPVEIAAVIMWRVHDSAQATFDVDQYEQFVAVQSETAVRHLASQYPYDTHDEAVTSLRANMDEVAEALRKELSVRLDKAGVEVMESRLSHLAYGAEIAGAMLRRQQAGAVVAARMRIVDGAVGMVEMALERLAEKNTVHLDDERKAAMVSNLLVVLCGEQAASPVINAGTLYT